MAAITRRAALAAPLIALPGLAQAQAWRPPGPTRIIVPAAAGGTTDIMARMVAQFLDPRWNIPVVVENRTGAGGSYNVYVRMSDGRETVVTQSDLGGIRQGSYVRVYNGRAWPR